MHPRAHQRDLGQVCDIHRRLGVRQCVHSPRAFSLTSAGQPTPGVHLPSGRNVSSDQHTQVSSSANGPSAAIATPIQNDTAHQLVEVVQQRLGSTVTALNSASQALTALHAKQSTIKQGMTCLGRSVTRFSGGLRPMKNPLLEAIDDLNRSIKEQRSPVQLRQSEIETMFQEPRSNTTTTAERVRPAQKDGDPGKSSRFT